MKTPEECIKWIDTLLSNKSFTPNVEDQNFLKSIKHYLDLFSKYNSLLLISKEYNQNPPGYVDTEMMTNKLCETEKFIYDNMVKPNMPEQFERLIENYDGSINNSYVVLDSLGSKITDNLGEN